jgi:hypothetical protein
MAVFGGSLPGELRMHSITEGRRQWFVNVAEGCQAAYRARRATESDVVAVSRWYLTVEECWNCSLTQLN